MGKTSSKVKNRYNEKNYKRINVALKIELVDQFKEKLKKENKPAAEFFREKIEEYLKED